MSERLVSYVEPRLRRLLIWGCILLSIGLAVLVRLTIGSDPFVVIAALILPIPGMFLLLHLFREGDRITVAERDRRYQAASPFWERVLLRALFFGFALGVLRVDESMDSLRKTINVMLILAIASLVFGYLTEWITQWATRRSAE